MNAKRTAFLGNILVASIVGEVVQYILTKLCEKCRKQFRCSGKKGKSSLIFYTLQDVGEVVGICKDPHFSILHHSLHGGKHFSLRLVRENWGSGDGEIC